MIVRAFYPLILMIVFLRTSLNAERRGRHIELCTSLPTQITRSAFQGQVLQAPFRAPAPPLPQR